MKASGLLTLLVIAGLGIGITVALQHAASPRIQAAQEQARDQEWSSVLPRASYDNQPLRQPLTLPVSDSSVLSAYLATRAGRPCAVIFHSRGQGYAGPVELLVGVSAEGRLLGIKLLEQHETPGIGARIASEPQWLNGFSGKSLDGPGEANWAVKTDNGAFDQIAGATITSRAVVDTLRDTLRYFDNHQAQLLPQVGGQP
ncbi:hypothetical protein ALQ04_00003 [Pseudomonas cichorii]|uniref:Ion-translocating oxidoreductase complex subunit G n=1 Tax=Pseudomonas cichorii TaxID=36746 RepID=A0A3M4LZZ2_PSECI|nr:RnfABCDGE type electron transport complex subunit G [Pseudomonas cichorii]RMQ47027.1 hypothetical protein ALQ04_00003 [Pseudomonas cichorii]